MSGHRRFPVLVWLMAVAAAVGCSPPPADATVELRVPVFVREAGTGDVEDRIVATGTLRASKTVFLRAETGGELRVATNAAGRRLQEGDLVEAGTTIAEIIGEEVRIAARSEVTRQRYESALRDWESKKKLFDEGLISELEFRPVVTELADAKIEWERSKLTEVRSRLVTPIAGRILMLARDERGSPMADGQLVTQGFDVARIAPTGSLIADVDLVGSDVARVREGQPARVRYHAWDGTSFEGRVVRLAPTLDATTRTLRAEVRVDNAKGLLRPGMFVEVTIVAERREAVTVVPREAVTERGGRKVVFVLRGQKVSQRDVALGLGDDEQVEVRQGIEVGERIVVRGLETLQDDMRVRVSGT